MTTSLFEVAKAFWVSLKLTFVRLKLPLDI